MSNIFRDRRTLSVAAALVATAAAALVAISGCGSATGASTASDAASAQTPAEPQMRVETVRVGRQDLKTTVEMPGSVEGIETADLYAKVGGYLAEIHVDIGDAVEEGQVLAELSIPEMQKELQQKEALRVQAEADAEQAAAAIRQAEADVTSAEAMLAEARTERAERQSELQYREVEYNRFQEMVRSQSARPDLLDQARHQYQAAKSGLQTAEARIQTASARVAAAQASVAKAQADYRSAQASIDVAKAAVEQAKTMLAYGQIRAPFSGYVIHRNVDAGAFVRPGDSAAKPLLTITRSDVVRVFVDVPMRDVQFLDRGDHAVLNQITAIPGKEFVGTVTRFSPALGKQTRLMRAEVDFKNPDGLLRPGYYGYMTVLLENLPATPVIPSSALLSEDGHAYVYVIRDGVAQKQPVTVGYQDGIVVGITSGLAGGEEVVRAGGAQIMDGQRLDSVVSVATGDVLNGAG